MQKTPSSKKKQTEILSSFNGIERLSDLIQCKELIPKLLHTMQAAITPQKPSVLGILGEDVLRTGIARRYDFDNFYYRKAENTFIVEEAEVPYIIEMAVATECCHHKTFEMTDLNVIVGINNSLSYGNPFEASNYFHYSTKRLSLAGFGLISQDKTLNPDGAPKKYPSETLFLKYWKKQLRLFHRAENIHLAQETCIIR